MREGELGETKDKIEKGEWQMKQKHRLLVLFLKTLYISAFTFGGGFVIVTFMKKCFVDELHWIDEQECLILPHWHSPVRARLR